MFHLVRLFHSVKERSNQGNVPPVHSDGRNPVCNLLFVAHALARCDPVALAHGSSRPVCSLQRPAAFLTPVSASPTAPPSGVSSEQAVPPTLAHRLRQWAGLSFAGHLTTPARAGGPGTINARETSEGSMFASLEQRYALVSLLSMTPINVHCSMH